MDRRQRPIRYAATTVLSTAQNQEDVLLWRAFREQPTGFYLDIGAGDPNWDSVTRWFYRQGWRGINIEPNPLFGPAYAHWRPGDINLNVGVADVPGKMRFYQVQPNSVGHGWGLSSFDPQALEVAMRTGLQVEQIEVETRPLREIIIQYAPSVTTDFMKVDVEGFERTVLLSADWRVFRPRVILVESIRPASSEPSHQGWEDVLLNAGYSFALFDGVNAFYVRDADKDLMVQFNAGVNVNDHWRRAEAADM